MRLQLLFFSLFIQIALFEKMNYQNNRSLLPRIKGKSQTMTQSSDAEHLELTTALMATVIYAIDGPSERLNQKHAQYRKDKN